MKKFHLSVNGPLTIRILLVISVLQLQVMCANTTRRYTSEHSPSSPMLMRPHNAVNQSHTAGSVDSQPTSALGFTDPDRLCYAAHQQPNAHPIMYGQNPLPDHYGMFAATYNPKRINVAGEFW